MHATTTEAAVQSSHFSPQKHGKTRPTKRTVRI